jgi:regulator of replication initiation timing
MAVENDQLREMTAELERRLQALETDDQQVRAENARLREELTELHRRLGALTAAEAEFKAEVTALLGQAEQALGSLITKSQRLAGGGPPQREPRLRSV